MRKSLVGIAACLLVVAAVVVVSMGVAIGPDYELRCGAISSAGFALLKFDRHSGRSWVALESNEWKSVQEPSPLPAGKYDVHVEQYATKDTASKETTEWQMFRINKSTGQSWVLMSRGQRGKQESRWQEIADAK